MFPSVDITDLQMNRALQPYIRIPESEFSNLSIRTRKRICDISKDIIRTVNQFSKEKYDFICSTKKAFSNYDCFGYDINFLQLNLEIYKRIIYIYKTFFVLFSEFERKELQIIIDDFEAIVCQVEFYNKIKSEFVSLKKTINDFV